MDKKHLTNRTQMPCSLAVENGRKNDNGKYGRGGFKREGNTNCYTKSDVCKVPLPQKSKAFADKRPKSRSYGYDWAKEEVMKVKGEYSIDQDTSRKVNLNHLLNFSFAPRGTNRNVAGWRGGYREMPGRTKFNKEQFVQANCQFVVKADCDYSRHETDPDTLVDWEYIEQINMLTSEPPLCPICLYTPAPAKMTRCGHIYCWPCILHYLALDEQSWRKCPICYDAVRKEHLKSVKTCTVARYSPGDQISMRLMKKLKGSTRVVPADPSPADEPPGATSDGVTDAGDTTPYLKLMYTTNTDVLKSIVEPEKQILLDKMSGNPEESEVCFIESALSLLQERELFLQSCKAVRTPSRVTGKDENGNSAADDEKPWRYFYQAMDGQQIFIHSVNARCLMSQYGSLENAPYILRAEVVEVESHIMTKELRKRLRYLSHLPLTCEFLTVEMNLEPPIVTTDTLVNFQDELEKRRRQRQRRVRDDSRHRRRVQRDEDRKLGIYPAMTARIDSKKQFPDYCSLQSPHGDSETSSQASGVSSSSHGTPFGSPNTAALCALDIEHPQAYVAGAEASEYGHHLVSPTSRSFAEMLRNSNTRTTHWPMLASSPSSAPAVDAADPEDYAPAPTIRATFGDVFQAAFENCTLAEDACGGRKKKKKQKSRLLFSTSMNWSLGN